MVEVALNVRGDEQLTVDNTAGGVALTRPTGFRPRHAFIAVTNAEIRWAASTAPTATLGIPVVAGAYIDWTDPLTDFTNLITNPTVIRTRGASAGFKRNHFCLGGRHGT